MGLFVDSHPNPTPVQAVLEAAYLDAERSPGEARDRAAAEAPGLAQGAARSTKVYKTGNIVFALVFFLVLLGLAIAAETFDWVKDTDKIYEFAGLVLGVITGFLGGESSS